MTGGTASAAWVYNQTVKLFAAGAEPAFEDPGELERTWGRAWGLDNDVGRIRSILMHRPGPEMAVVDPTKRIVRIGSFGDIERSPDRPAYNETQDCQTQIDASFNHRVRQYVCAGNKDSKTPGKSLFAAKLLETLRQGNADADGILHFDDLTYALGKVRSPEPVHGSFAGHDPGGEFVFVWKDACATPPDRDRDGDNVPDALDHCPDTWGSQSDGCPPKSDNAGDDTARDLAAWKTAKQQKTEAAYRDYLRQFPQGEFKEQANQALRQIEADAVRRRDDTAWDVAVEKNTLEGYNKYLKDHSEGLHRTEAEAKIKDLEKKASQESEKAKDAEKKSKKKSTTNPRFFM